MKTPPCYSEGVSLFARIAGLVLVAATVYGQSPPLLDTLSQELERNFSALKTKADPAPYFLSYAVEDEESFLTEATLGALQSANSSRRRVLDVTVRVGSYKLDNYHRIRGENPRFSSAVVLPLEDDAVPVRHALWLETDRTYRQAAQRLIKIRTDQQVKAEESDTSADFSSEEPSVASIDVPRIDVSPEEWKQRVRRWSAQFSQYPSVLNSTVTVAFQRETKYVVNTEGTRLKFGRDFARIMISAQAKAADGMDLITSESFEAVDPSGMPDDRKVTSAIEKVARDLDGLLKAPVVEPFVGPAILSGRAAGVFFHEIFGHRVEGHRQKDETEGQTFTKMVGNQVLPDFLSVIFDPTLHKYETTDLNGWYDYDDEGVKARRVPVVESGMLRTFLMSRSTIKGFDHSNGHGRRQLGFEVVSRQSNLLVKSSNTVSDTRLREMLKAEIRLQNKPYGLYFDQVTGGYTTTQRRGLQAFTVIPLVVYRVYPDNRPDELVRGADIVGTPLASFTKIAATADKGEVFNGYCGAESGSVSVSAVSPALLVTEIEIQKKPSSQDRPPLLPRPTTGTE